VNHMARRRIARTALEVPVLGFGGATLGDAQGAISEHQALAALEAGYAAGIDYFDTSPWYGNGKSEGLVGRLEGTGPPRPLTPTQGATQAGGPADGTALTLNAAGGFVFP